jgi:alpha/beta superfamily hydrolase
VSEVRRLWIEGPVGRIEAMVRVANPARACALVAHPHPLHGGTMHNPVVFHADRELHRRGMTTMRFNFRGVGASDGEHDEGRGEVEDVAAALAWLRGLGPGVPQLFVGYSFGSWCGYRLLLADRAADAFVAIGLPVRHYAFDRFGDLGVPVAVVQGEHDEFGAPEEVRDVVSTAKPPGVVHAVAGAEHLFPRRAPDAASAVVTAAEELLERIGVEP